MKIAVNTRLLRKNKLDGIGWFTNNTLERIVKTHSDIEFHFLFDSKADEEFIYAANVIPHNLFPPTRHALLNIAWSEYSVKRILGRIRPNLYFSPDGMLCLGWKGPQHGVVHDINFMHHPEYLKFSNRKYYRHFFPQFAKKATRLATVSEFSKQDIHAAFGIDGSKIDVVYCGINSFFRPVSSEIVTATRARFSEGEPYFLFVGTLSPRKNIEGLLQAFDLYKTETGHRTKLLIIGGSMYGGDNIFDIAGKIRSKADVVFAGRQNNTELNQLYGAALSLVFVPFFEGFGIPLVEAMQCDLPIIASNVSAVPEVAGSAALYVNPRSIHEIKNAMVRIASDPVLRTALIQQGRERRNHFTWDKTAGLLWDSIEKCL